MRPANPLPLACALVLGLATPRQAHAAWPPDGVSLCGGYPPCDGRGPVPARDGSGGAFVVWGNWDHNSQGDLDIYLQRVTGAGEIPPGWPAAGLPVSVGPFSKFHGWPIPDGSGGVIVGWQDSRDVTTGGDIYAQRIRADGSVAWAGNGVPVTRLPRSQSALVSVSDGAGGAYFSWYNEWYDGDSLDVWVQRLTGDGVPAAGWPADGVPICTLPSAQSFPQVASDGQGGVFVAWHDEREVPAGVYAQRVLPSGAIAPGWPDNGVRIVSGRYIRNLAADGAGGAYLSCATAGNGFYDGSYYLQRITPSGTIAPGWPEGGAPVCTAPGFRGSVRVVPDGEGGVHLAWDDYREFPSRPDEIYVQRMQSDGTPYPGWPVNGLRVTDNYHFDDFPDLAPDGSGGVYLCWVQCCYAPPADDVGIVQHLTGAGAVVPGWPAGGMAIPSQYANELPHITADGQGGAIVAWESGTDVRALRFVADGPTPVQVALVSAEASPDRVQLVWYGSGAAGLDFALERRTSTADWQRLATLTADGGGTLRYEDRAVIPGGRYAYRLGYPDGGAETFTAETWVDVPPGFALALEGLRPNPALGALIAAFTLPNADPATLELLDLNGRRILAHEVGTLGAGSHRLRLDSAAPVPAGIYWLRLRQGARTLVARGAVIR